MSERKMLNQYLTIYRKDYDPKQLKNTKIIRQINSVKNKEYPDPINESFKHYLCLDPCKEKYSEELDSYFDEAINNYPGFKYFTNKELINKATIRKNKIYDGRTEYQVIYCDLEKEIADKEYCRKNAVVLPNDTYIPLTTQKAGYRYPLSINPRAYERISVPKPKNNLDPNHTLRKILNVTTGETEYMGIIGKLGDRIVVEQLHGYIPML